MSEVCQKSSSYRVYYEDTDIAGVVYHANYLKYMERGRTDFLESYGFNLISLFKQGVQFVVSEVSIKFLKAASLNDHIIVNTELLKCSGAKMVFSQSIHKQGESNVLCRAQIVVGCLDGQFKPTRIPQALIKELK